MILQNAIFHLSKSENLVSCQQILSQINISVKTDSCCQFFVKN